VATKLYSEQIVPEKFLYEIWKERDFLGNFITNNGEQIQIIDPGLENKELDGPDFLNAKIKIGNITFTGDVEIDSFASDWKDHGHYLNNKYNKVILHLFFGNGENTGYVFTADGRKVHSIEIKKHIKDNVSKAIQKAILSERQNRIGKMPCIETNKKLSEKEKLDFILELGIKRFNSKRMKALERIKELAYLRELNLEEPVIKYELDENFFNRTFKQTDFCEIRIWQQLVYEFIFEALGYSANKDLMKTLAQAVNIDFLSKFKNKPNFFELIDAALFNVSGLIPDCTSITDETTANYVRSLLEDWNKIKNTYDGKKFNATQWHFAKLRPPNFPTVRLAAGVKYLYKIINNNMIDYLIRKIEYLEDQNAIVSELRGNLIIKSWGYWKSHYVFDQSNENIVHYIVGKDRADEIIINIILPIISIYFEIFGKKNLSKKILGVFLNYTQNSDNSIVRQVSATLQLDSSWKRSVLYQGMIGLFRYYCSTDSCLECEIGKKAFA